ncbi:ATP dependent DNA ligase [Pseudonocardia dioxanivorans]|uniref:ATP dependent DNA ligase n=1 Tax=Pseudonocardia dioxanivorans TaxID=240495 RepID=UPI000CD016AF|nr:hypothetical protein [Pseudonocardia dioxanivorans]
MQIRVKVKHRTSTELVVGGVTGTRNRPTGLILGRVRDGRLRVVGRTTALSPAAQDELTTLFRKPRGDHPWPPRIPAGRFGQLGADPVEYKQVEPSVVVEVATDVAFEYGRWRHPARFIRVRRDLAADDLT